MSKKRYRQKIDGLSSLLKKLHQLVEKGQHDAVVSEANNLLRLMPKNPFVLKALSFGLIGRGDHDAALAVLEQAISVAPTDPELYSNLGIAQSVTMHWHEALSSFTKALELDSSDPVVWKNKGSAYSFMNRWDEAIPCFIKAIELFLSDDNETISELAAALLNAGRVDEAIRCYSLMLAEDRDNAFLLASQIGARLRICDWSSLADDIHRLQHLSGNFEENSISPFHALQLPGINESVLKKIAESTARREIPPSLLESPWSTTCDYQASKSGRKLRIGYISYDFNNHAVAHVIPEVFELHDRTRVVVHAYSIGPDDGSEIRSRIMRNVDHFVDIANMGIRAGAEVIKSDDIDILVDLQGWTTGRRTGLMALRPAPIQVNWLGFAGTIGHPRLADFVIADSVSVPVEHEGNFVERVVRMSPCYLPLDTKQHLGRRWSRAEAGLPDTNVFVFCSPNNSYKLNPEVFDVWCHILLATEDSVLWLAKASDSCVENLRREAVARGVAPERLIFATRIDDRADYLSRLQLADLVLDPSPYNSHSSGLDVLWSGVPMVALLGNTFAGRVGASLLLAAGLPECVTTEWRQYVDLCVALYRDRGRLADLRKKLAANRKSAPLFDMPLFVRNLESLYLEMIDQMRHPSGSARGFVD